MWLALSQFISTKMRCTRFVTCSLLRPKNWKFSLLLIQQLLEEVAQVGRKQVCKKVVEQVDDDADFVVFVRAVFRQVSHRLAARLFVASSIQHHPQHVHHDASLSDEPQLLLIVVQKRSQRIDEVRQYIVAV
jgi:hypothetical protein